MGGYPRGVGKGCEEVDSTVQPQAYISYLRTP
jgi:hypothetical protein